MLDQLRKPVVVPDLNYLQNLPKGREYLSSKNYWLWPLRLFQEVSDREEKSAASVGKLLKIYRLNADRSCIAKSPRELCVDDGLHDLITTHKNLVDLRMTQLIRIASESDDPKSLANALGNGNEHLANGHNTFWMLMQLSNQIQDDEFSNFQFNSDIESDRKLITAERSMSHFSRIVSLLDSNTSNPPPSFSHLNETTSPLLAMAKCLLYLRLRTQVKPLLQAELNDFDDIHYATLGALTGYIAANDKGLRRMIRVCFPGTTILSNKHAQTVLEKALV